MPNRSDPEAQPASSPAPPEPGTPATAPPEAGGVTGQDRDDAPQRLQKVLARAGLGSRRACEELVADGRVSVNGAVARLGDRVIVGQAEVAVDGVVLTVAPQVVCYLLNKPVRVVSTASDPQGRATVVQLVPAEPRVFPVGRLDYHTEGLLLLTNDGDLAHRLMHPSHGIEKEYLAHVAGAPSAAVLRRLRQGVQLDDGVTSPAKVSQPQRGVLRLVISEGRNRQVRRMCEAVGHPAKRLVRTRIGPIKDPGLAPGKWRPLTTTELRALEQAAQGAARGPNRGTTGVRRG